MSKEDYKDMQGWIEGMPRFYIEQRIGCIAVIDSENRDTKENGLHEDSKGVVWFKMGERHTCTCKTCGKSNGVSWEISESLVDEAVKVADKHNDLIKEKLSDEHRR